jgi:uncharacterized membrane protein
MAGRRRGPSLGNYGVPLLYAAGAFLLGLALPRLETAYFPYLNLPISADAALAIGSSIASGMMALTGIVFSLAFVMVQFSATAYSPRLVLWLARSPIITHSIGVFTATFLYALAALAWVDRSGTRRVPGVTMWVGVVLLLLSVFFFVLLVERIGMLQIGRVLAFIGDQGRTVIDQVYRPVSSRPAPVTAAVRVELGRLPVTQEVLHLGPPAAVEKVDVPALLQLATAAGGATVVAVAVAVGDTVMEGIPLFRVHGGGPLSEESLRGAMALGRERTFEQDPKYALRLLVDVGIKALSPAINDPTTAVQALDQIGDLLQRLGKRDLDTGRVLDAGGQLRVTLPLPGWEDLIGLALDEIRYCGATSVQVMRRLRALLLDLIADVPPERHPALRRQMERVDRSIVEHFPDADDLRAAQVEDRQGLGLSREDRAS